MTNFGRNDHIFFRALLQGGRPKCACSENLKNLSFYSLLENKQVLKRNLKPLCFIIFDQDLKILSS